MENEIIRGEQINKEKRKSMITIRKSNKNHNSIGLNKIKI